ncbi:hypothetical protein EDB85DRAFT_1892252 [Lactarius pseudohatsudake]|nr:hypothetical protein EDB85DRAFT_1892252 [Lactarius pseudohatsudake]
MDASIYCTPMWDVEAAICDLIAVATPLPIKLCTVIAARSSSVSFASTPGSLVVQINRPFKLEVSDKAVNRMVRIIPSTLLGHHYITAASSWSYDELRIRQAPQERIQDCATERRKVHLKPKPSKVSNDVPVSNHLLYDMPKRPPSTFICFHNWEETRLAVINWEKKAFLAAAYRRYGIRWVQKVWKSMKVQEVSQLSPVTQTRHYRTEQGGRDGHSYNRLADVQATDLVKRLQGSFILVVTVTIKRANSAYGW